MTLVLRVRRSHLCNRYVTGECNESLRLPRRSHVSVFELYLSDNDSYAFREYPALTEYQKVHQSILPDMSGPPRSGIRRCRTCGELLDKWEECPDDIEIRDPSYDVSTTFDGVVVVSEAFRQVYEKGNLTGLRFKRLRCTPPLYYISASRAVEFDYERSGTCFCDKCGSCGRYKTTWEPPTSFSSLEAS